MLVDGFFVICYFVIFLVKFSIQALDNSFQLALFRIAFLKLFVRIMIEFIGLIELDF